jgi:hypothetical protein
LVHDEDRSVYLETADEVLSQVEKVTYKSNDFQLPNDPPYTASHDSFRGRLSGPCRDWIYDGFDFLNSETGECLRDRSVFEEYSDDRELVSPMYPKTITRIRTCEDAIALFERRNGLQRKAGMVTVISEEVPVGEGDEHEYAAFYQREDGLDFKVDVFGCTQF